MTYVISFMNQNFQKTQYILEPEQCKMIYNIAFVSLFSSMFGMYRQLYSHSIYPFVVFLTSINYWRHPDYSWRRYLDMTIVSYSMICQMFQSMKCVYQKYYLFFTFLALISYQISIYYYAKNDNWKSTYFNCLLHIFANISLIFLFTGVDPKRI